MNHILINATHSEEIRVAIVRNKKLTSLNIETSLNQKNKGNIYKGKISRVEQSLEAAFVDYGKERQGFLPFKEVTEIVCFDVCYYTQNLKKILCSMRFPCPLH
jgi:ribonuclease E